MFFDEKRNRIVISARELVRRGSGDRMLREDTDILPLPLADIEEQLNLERGGLRFAVSAPATHIEHGRLRLDAEARIPGDEALDYIKALASVAGYIYGCKHNLTSLHLSAVMLSAGTPLGSAEQTCSFTSLETYFFRLLDRVMDDSAHEIDRVCRRLPMMSQAPYPYSSLREGQGDLINAVYRGVRQKKRLFASAPTGIGKTMSVLFGAVRALADGGCEKIFYLTSKNTGAASAAAAADDMIEAGAPLCAMKLSAKETMCPNGTVCRRGGRCDRTASGRAKTKEATGQLLNKCAGGCIREEQIAETAAKFGLCPYELSLDLSEYCDLIICDYNYLFDVDARLRRYFTIPGSWCFLVDEAHGLCDRARDGYSYSLTPEQLSDMGRETMYQPLMPLFDAAASALTAFIEHITHDSRTTDGAGVCHRFAAEKQAPNEVLKILGELCDRCFDAAGDKENRPPREIARALRTVGYKLLSILNRADLFDDRFIMFYTGEGLRYRMRQICLDPSEVLASALDMGSSAVLFSATLYPIEYYRDALGGCSDDPTLELSSPFDSDNLAIFALDRIPVRWSQRGETLREVVRVIFTTLRAKPGNYMVFCPSFAYLEKLREQIKKVMPNLPLICQRQSMSESERAAFLREFETPRKGALVGLCVMGGIYGEGVDLMGERLIGAIVIGVGLPGLSDEREAIREYYDTRDLDGTAYAYTYPGLCKVLQAGGRVIRSETDRGVLILIDDRFALPQYRHALPEHWHTLKYASHIEALGAALKDFWSK